VAIIYEDIIVS